MAEATADPARALASALRAALGSDAVRDQPADCLPYGSDNSKQGALPGLVLAPDHHDQVVTIIEQCREHRVPLITRGRGTGTTAAAVPPPGAAVLSTERLDRLLEVNRDDRYARVQPGITNGDLQRALAEHGLFWPPDPTSADYCTIGGNLACNAAGPRALKYGTPRDNTLGLTAVTGSADTIRTGCRTTKGVVGYDLTRLLIGSEGTLAVITEAVLRLTPLPTGRCTLRACYPSMQAAAQAVARIMAQAVTPAALEYMDAAALALVRDDDLPDDTEAVLLVEVDGSGSILTASADAVAAAAEAGASEVRRARDEAESVELWRVRKALSPALRQAAPGKVNEDVVVPVSRMAELIQRLQDLSAEHRIPIVSFGHAGNGNIHVNLLYNPTDAAQRESLQPCLEAVFRAVLDLGGTLSGEHGIGRIKRGFVGLEIGEVELDLMRRIRAEFDPDGILNPGSTLPDLDAPPPYARPGA
jgi:glycolate oxidase subunit GlcD